MNLYQKIVSNLVSSELNDFYSLNELHKNTLKEYTIKQIKKEYGEKVKDVQFIKTQMLVQDNKYNFLSLAKINLDEQYKYIGINVYGNLSDGLISETYYSIIDDLYDTEEQAEKIFGTNYKVYSNSGYVPISFKNIKTASSSKFKFFNLKNDACNNLLNYAKKCDIIALESGIRMSMDVPIIGNKIYEPKLTIIRTESSDITGQISGDDVLKKLQSITKEITGLLAKAIIWNKECRKFWEEISEKEDANNNSDLYKVGDIWGGTWTYNMTLAMFAKIIAVTPKSVKFQLLGKKQVGGNAWQPKVVPDESKTTKTVMVRMPKDPKWGVKVDGYYLYKWDGNPIEEDHMD